MINLLFIEAGTSGGGSFGSLYELVRSLDKTEYNIRVLYFNQPPQHDKLDALGVKWNVLADPIYSRSVNWFTKKLYGRLIWLQKKIPHKAILIEKQIHRNIIKKIRAIIIDDKIDLIHTNNQPLRDFYALLSSDALSIPIISHIRSRITGPPPCKRKLSTINKEFTAFICCAEEVGQNWVDNGLTHKNMYTVYNGISLKKSKPVDLNKEFSINKNKLKIVCVGRFINIKFQSLLLEAISLSTNLLVNSHLILIGSGEDEQKLKSQCKELGIEGIVTFAGIKANAECYIAASDVLVNCSKTESCSRVILEAMVNEIPVVASAVGGTPELIKNNINGLLFPCSDAIALCKALVNILNNPSKRVLLGKNGYSTVVERFSLDRYVDGVTDIYKRILH